MTAVAYIHTHAHTQHTPPFYIPADDSEHNSVDDSADALQLHLSHPFQVTLQVLPVEYLNKTGGVKRRRWINGGKEGKGEERKRVKKGGGREVENQTFVFPICQSLLDPVLYCCRMAILFSLSSRVGDSFLPSTLYRNMKSSNSRLTG